MRRDFVASANVVEFELFVMDVDIQESVVWELASADFFTVSLWAGFPLRFTGFLKKKVFLWFCWFSAMRWVGE